MMKTPFRTLYHAGFTLIELLIVVIIIAILAAIAIPQFSNTTSDAQESSLDANLNNLRSAIELYRVQHSNVFPAVKAASGGAADCTTAGGALGTGDAGSGVALKEQLTQYSDAAGHTCTTPAAGFIYGPYLREMPKEPVTNPASEAIEVVSAAGAAAAPAAATGGWRYNTATGRIDMNSNANDRRGNPLWKH